MSIQKINPKVAAIGAILILVALLRVVFSIGNGSISPLAVFTPIGAMALFGGACFTDKTKAFAWPLLTLWLSDIFLNRFVFYVHWRLFYEDFYWTYGAFALIVLTGRYLVKTITIPRIVLASVTGVLIHWIVTDFGVWLDGSMYAKTFDGFITCLVAAVPYEKDFLIGTLLYGGLMFGSFEWMARSYKWQPIPAS